MRIELPGGWAELKDVDDLVGDDLIAVQDKIPIAEEGQPWTAAVMTRARYALLARIVTGWSLDLPLPGGEPAIIGQVPIGALKALMRAVGPHMELLQEAASPNRDSSSD